MYTDSSKFIIQKTAVEKQNLYKLIQEMLLVLIYQRVCITSRKFVGSIPDDVIGIFH
jgi:hypothetical protein